MWHGNILKVAVLLGHTMHSIVFPERTKDGGVMYG